MNILNKYILNENTENEYIYIHYSLKQFFHTTEICLLQCYDFYLKIFYLKIHTHIIQKS